VHAFDYLMVLAAVIVGLALTHILVGVTRMVEGPPPRGLFWVHLVWLAGVFLTVLLWWWAEFDLSGAGAWTFAMYLFVVAYAVLLFLMSAALVPSTGVVDYRSFFDARKTWFLSLIVAYAVIDFVDSALRGSGHLRDLGWPYMLSEGACIVLPIVAMFVRSTTFQGLIAIAFLADQFYLGFRSFAIIQ